MQKENETKVERKTQRGTSGKLLNGAHRGAEAQKSKFLTFSIFLIFSNFVSLK
jgi:hypothetical protein